MRVTSAISSGFVRGGANANPEWAMKFLGLPTIKVQPAIEVRASPASPESMELGKISPKIAKQMGFTGDQCDTCASMKMKISGHCMVCEDCGTTTGCS